MIGWRVGWVAGPAPIVADIGLVGLTNVVCQVGIAQQAVAAALTAPDADADVAAATAIWQQRAQFMLTALADYPCVRPDGGWSLLIDTIAARPVPRRAEPPTVRPRPDRGHADDRLGPDRRPLPAAGLRQRAGRAAARHQGPVRAVPALGASEVMLRCAGGRPARAGSASSPSQCPSAVLLVAGMAQAVLATAARAGRPCLGSALAHLAPAVVGRRTVLRCRGGIDVSHVWGSFQPLAGG